MSISDIRNRVFEITEKGRLLKEYLEFHDYLVKAKAGSIVNVTKNTSSSPILLGKIEFTSVLDLFRTWR